MASESDTHGGGAVGLVALLPLVYGVMGPPPAEGAPPELREIVILNPLTFGVRIVEGSPEMLYTLLSAFGAPVAAVGNGGPPPASKASIEAMKTVYMAGGEDCPVCLDELKNVVSSGPEAAEVVKEMPCEHRFHGGCIERWLGMHGSCPVCRYRMPADGDAGIKEDA